MEAAILLLPLISSVFILIIGARIVGGLGASFILIMSLFISWIYSIITFYYFVISGVVVYYPLHTWISVQDIHVILGLYIDSLSIVMIVLVLTISLMVHIYSFEYMNQDPHLPRFLSYLSLFTFFMLLLVSSNNFIQLFFGWEGIGICSYLLINFWYTRTQANLSAMKAVMVNRIGDFSLLMALGLIYYCFKSFNYATIFSCVSFIQDKSIELNLYFFDSVNVLTLISFFIMFAAVGKSAQIFLHTWLPDAMEGPTPVSALLHAATMVTAGIFLILRSSYIIGYSSIILWMMLILGIGTAIFASLSALFQTDLKKIIAYSTCSQLGYMFFCCGLSQYSVSMFHLWNHGFFKALLFLSAGSIIHATKDEQDIRRMGGLFSFLPLTMTAILIGSLALSGFPFLAGFYSKDVIIMMSYSLFTFTSHGIFVLASIMALTTALYSGKLLYYVFFEPTTLSKGTLQYLSEPSIFMLFPLIFLSVFSVLIGYLTEDLLIGPYSPFWLNSLNTSSVYTFYVNEYEFYSVGILLLPTVLSLFGTLIGELCYRNIILYYYRVRSFLIFETAILLSLQKYFNKNWSFDNIYNSLVISKILFFSYHITFKLLDRGVLELFGPYGLSTISGTTAKMFSRGNIGLLSSYVMPILLCLLIILILFVFLDTNLGTSLT